MELDELKRKKNSEKSKIKKNIIALLSKKRDMTKGELFDALTELSPLTVEQLKDLSANGITSFYRGLMGMAISELIVTADIIKSDGYYRLNVEAPIVIKRNEVYEYLKNLFEIESSLTKQQIFSLSVKRFGTDKTKSEKDDNQLRSYLGEILSNLEKSELITIKNGRYSLIKEKGKTIHSFDGFIKKLNNGGGEFFERYSAMLLKKYYEKLGFSVEECKVTGGSDDGGVDVIIRTVDTLGFKDFITVQVKVRTKAQITLKEVREFIGAMHIKGGTRGIYITTSSYHPEAEKLILSVSNVTALDGKKVYEIAKDCGMLNV